MTQRTPSPRPNATQIQAAVNRYMDAHYDPLLDPLLARADQVLARLEATLARAEADRQDADFWRWDDELDS